MRALAKLMVGAVLIAMAAAAVFVADIGWNDSRLFYYFAGRDQLEQACRPLIISKLESDGFSPVDLTFDAKPSIGFISGSGTGKVRTLDAAITFSDGSMGQRVDGRARCTVSGTTTDVQVDVDSLPRRTT